MNYQPNWMVVIPIIAAVFGAFLGAFLKPLLDQWFERRRKTILITIDDPYVFQPPQSELKLKWRDHTFERLINLTFNIHNATGGTVRGLTLHFVAPTKQNLENFSYLAFENSLSFRVGNYEAPGTVWDIDFEHIERNATIKGFLMSDYARAISVHTMNDYEISVQSAESNWRKFLFRRIGDLVAGAAVMGLVLSLLKAIVGV